MLRLLAVLLCALCLAAHADEMSDVYTTIHGDGTYTTGQANQASTKKEALRKRWSKGGLITVAEDSNRAIGIIFKIAVMNLRKRGHAETANQVESGWRRIDGDLIRLASNPSRAITDFEPWNKELAALYYLVEFKLGYQLCYTLRITDLATFLWSPVVCFNPCFYGEQNFFEHFAHDKDGKYRALLPTTAYWVTTASCAIGTFAMGIMFPICSPLAYLVELGVDKYLAPALSPKIYEWSCSR